MAAFGLNPALPRPDHLDTALRYARPIGYNLATNRRLKPNWKRCAVASIVVGLFWQPRVGLEYASKRLGLEWTLRPRGSPKRLK